MSITKLLVRWVQNAHIWNLHDYLTITNYKLQNSVIPFVQDSLAKEGKQRPIASTIERKWRMVVERQMAKGFLITPATNEEGYRIWIVKRRKQEPTNS